MRVISVPFIKYGCTLTVSSPGTASLGWRADPAFGEGRRSGALFFARRLDYMTQYFSSIYRDLVPSKQIIVTRDLSSTYRDWQKTRHRDPSLPLWAGSDVSRHLPRATNKRLVLTLKVGNAICIKIQYNEFVYLLPEKSVLLREQETINFQVYSFD